MQENGAFVWRVPLAGGGLLRVRVRAKKRGFLENVQSLVDMSRLFGLKGLRPVLLLEGDVSW